jgi:hypothetical protein
MQSKKSALFVATAMVVLVGLPRISRAQQGSRPAAASTAGNGGDYGYKFEDDPLSAGGFGPSDATIRVRPGPVRTTLIRPRTSFVPEMLKSVENL